MTLGAATRGSTPAFIVINSALLLFLVYILFKAWNARKIEGPLDLTGFADKSFPPPDSIRFIVWPRWAFRHPWRFAIAVGLFEGTIGAGGAHYLFRLGDSTSALVGLGFGLSFVVLGPLQLARWTPEKEARSRRRVELMPAFMNMFRWPTWVFALWIGPVALRFLVDAGFAVKQGNALKAAWFVECGLFLPLPFVRIMRWRKQWQPAVRSTVPQAEKLWTLTTDGVVEIASEESIGSPSRRLAARTIDTFIVLFLAPVLISPLIQHASGATTAFWEVGAFLIVGSTYEIAMNLRSATAGKLLLKLRIVEAEGRRGITVRTAVKRWAYAVLFLVVPILNIMTLAVALRDSERRTLYDRKAGTIVLRITRQQGSPSVKTPEHEGN
jgi:hypothetical protein